MRSILANMLLPFAAVAATAIPTDPARAATPCPRAAAIVQAPKAEPRVAPPALVRLVPCLRKLEAI